MARTSASSRTDAAQFLPWLVLAVCLGLWLNTQWNIRVSSDAVWLSGAAERVLAGEAMTDTYFDNNPPMSYMIYTPVALLSAAGFPAWIAIDIYGLLLISAAGFLCWNFLSRWPGLTKASVWGMFSAWLISITIFCSYEFAQKDHLIAITLVPFLLAQIFMTHKYKAPPWMIRAALILGTPFILVKPHYGLLPVILLTLRFFREKRLSIVFDFDFVCLAVGVVLYAATIILRFPDFLSIALADSLSLYVSKIYKAAFTTTFAILLISACLLTLVICAPRKKTELAPAVFLSVLAMASAIAYMAQLKGWSLHLLPTVSLIFPAISATALLYIKIPQKHEVKISALIVALFFSSGIFLPAINLKRITHEDYKSSPLVQYIHEQAEGSTFFMENWRTDVVGAASMYADVPQASRFLSLWFAPALVGNPDQALRDRYAGYIAEDFARYKPAFIAVWKEPPVKGAGLLELFGDNKAFKKEWKHYRKKETFEYQYGEFAAGPALTEVSTVIYDVYVRKN